MNARERFDSHTIPEPNSGCTLWTGHVAASGYGRGVGYGQFWHDGKHVQAHRFAWTLNVGPIPDGMFICHKCDQPACVRVDHLFIGGHTENMRDMMEKGRHPESRRAGCDRGHQYNTTNTRVSRSGHRQCRVCQRLRHNERNAARRTALAGEGS